MTTATLEKISSPTVTLHFDDGLFFFFFLLYILGSGLYKVRSLHHVLVNLLGGFQRIEFELSNPKDYILFKNERYITEKDNYILQHQSLGPWREIKGPQNKLIRAPFTRVLNS